MLKPFIFALQLLTRIPVPPLKQLDETERAKVAGRSILFYPLVGVVIGALLVAVQYGLTTLLDIEHQILQAAILLLAWVLITGALHLDGLADTADAWLGGMGDRQRTLDIMKDPYCGPAGVTAIVLLLMVKFSALIVLATTHWQALIIAPVLGRSAVVALFLTAPYVRQGGMGDAAAGNLPKRNAALMLLLALGFVAWLSNEKVVIVFAVVAIVWLWQRYRMLKRIGGTTGDTAGALVEITETVVLLCLIV